jgi:surface protein
MQNMFYNCIKLTSLDLSNFNTSKVTNMAHMLGSNNNAPYKTEFLDLSNFKINSDTDISHLFRYMSNLKVISLKHADKATCLRVVSAIMNSEFVSDQIEIYVQDTPASSLFNTNKVKFIDYRKHTTDIYLPQPLRSMHCAADRLYWDESRGCYCIEQNVDIAEDGTLIRLVTPKIIPLNDYNKKLGVKTYNPSTCVYTDDDGDKLANITMQIPYNDQHEN